MIIYNIHLFSVAICNGSMNLNKVIWVDCALAAQPPLEAVEP